MNILVPLYKGHLSTTTAFIGPLSGWIDTDGWIDGWMDGYRFGMIRNIAGFHKRQIWGLRYSPKSALDRSRTFFLTKPGIFVTN